MKTDGSGALHSETQAEDEGGEGAQAATFGSGERRARGMEDLDQTRAYLGDDSPEKQGKDDVEELADKVDCWAEDYWMAVEEWELEKLFKEPQKTRSGHSMVAPIQYR